MNRLNSSGWLLMFAGALLMDVAAGLIIWKEGLGWLNGVFALMAVGCTISSYKSYKEARD